MRFHHSTRRGRSRLDHNSQQLRWARHSAHNSSSGKWAQLSYCRETNIHFNRRLPVEPPSSLASSSFSPTPLPMPSPRQQHRPQPNSPIRTSTLLQENKHLQQQQRQQQDVLGTSGRNLIELSHKNSIRLKQLKNKQTNDRQDDDLKFQKLSIGDVDGQINDGGNSTKQQQLVNSTMGPKIDMEIARQKLIAQVEKHRLWSNKAAKKMQLSNPQERFIYIYELISFCERRDLEWCYEPYKGGLVFSIPYRRVSLSTPSSSPLSPELLKTSSPSSSSAAAASASELLAFSPIHKKTVLVESSQSPDSFWSTNSPSTSTSTSTPAVARTNSIRTTTSTTSTTGLTSSCRNSPMKKSLYDKHDDIPSPEVVWSIDVPMKPEPFYSQIHSSELPNSSFVKRCHGCQGKGKLKCNSCHGIGYEVCIYCHGNGTTKSLSSSHGSSSLSSGSRYKNSNYYSTSPSSSNDHHHNYNSRNSTFANGYDTDHDSLGNSNSSNSRPKGNEAGGITNGGGGISSSSGSAWVTESCHYCHGSGQKRCLMCAGKSYNHCAGCMGSGQLRCYLNLNITWINHRDEIILNNSDNIIPKERLSLCSGIMLVDEINDALLPLNCEYIDGATGRIEETNQLHLVSRKLLDKHKQSHRQERLIKQRHKVTRIDCHVVNYEWKQRRGHFVIYGDEEKVFIAKYPFRSICNIT